ncbi:MAG: GTPase ObgE [Patescibacteria group bacterium]|nr:GTPase ObgE [Patescibacteria group bacterium]MDE2015732.1 GTPase ObgE [Patescibacteria group bacterium]MDE2226789.1 GTPase ObgE [Patescibacteria group bacterium]
MLIDDIKIKVVAGKGGKGAVAFNKNLNSLGPAGASGGKGGSIYGVGTSDISALNQFRFKKEFLAENGGEGRSQFRDGKDGKDLILLLPVGTVIHNLTTKSDVSVEKIGERILIALGGIGGRGNFHFRSSTNTTPKQFQGGRPGEAFELRLELKLIADVGFVGFPNAGKSSMLNCLTNANSKVANYPFTTLEPNLGVYYELILADIPGLIEGSSSGKGLGIKFLRHVERTKILFHFVSSESLDPEKDYKTIRKELGVYNKELLEKPEYLFLSKSDLAEKTELKEKSEILRHLNPKMTVVSIKDAESIKKVERLLNKIKAEK